MANKWEPLQDMHVIYKITNIINQKVYIGQTNNPNLRWSQHKSSAKYNKGYLPISRAIAKYGNDSFIFEVVASCKTQENADILENLLIIQYDSQNKEKGYNIDSGGNVSIRSPETGRKISESLLKYYEIHGGTRKGIILSEETKNNMSIAAMEKPGTNLGKTFSQEWRDRIFLGQKGKIISKKLEKICQQVI